MAKRSEENVPIPHIGEWDGTGKLPQPSENAHYEGEQRTFKYREADFDPKVSPRSSDATGAANTSSISTSTEN